MTRDAPRSPASVSISRRPKTLPVWYQRVYDQPPAWKPASQLANRFVWLGGLVLCRTVQDFSWTRLKQVGGARVPIYIATFLALAFYWWTPTSCCWAGLPGGLVAVSSGSPDAPDR